MAEGEVVLVADMNTSNELVGIAACTGSDTQVAVVVATSCDTGLVGGTDAPCAVVVPERLWADMTAGSTFVPFQVGIEEVLPCIMVTGLMLPCECCVKSSLVQCSNTKTDTVTMALGKLCDCHA